MGENLENELQQFTGTEQYHKNSSGFFCTDGINSLAEEYGAYWLIDAVASHQRSPCLKRQRLIEFQLWKLEKHTDSSAALTCQEDTGIPPVVTQNIEFTDFPLDKFEFYVCQNVMMLKSEY